MSTFVPAPLMNVAQRLQAHAALGIETSDSASVVHGRLLERLAPFLGVAGTRALFARALKVTARDYPALRAVELGTGLEELAVALEACLRAQPPADAVATSVALCRTLLELLSTLIGERLVFQVLKSTWPALDVGSTSDVTHEEAK